MQYKIKQQRQKQPKSGVRVTKSMYEIQSKIKSFVQTSDQSSLLLHNFMTMILQVSFPRKESGGIYIYCFE